MRLIARVAAVTPRVVGARDTVILGSEGIVIEIVLKGLTTYQFVHTYSKVSLSYMMVRIHLWVSHIA